MAYTRNPTWQDSPSTVTPINAAPLNNLEAGLVTAAGVADAAMPKNLDTFVAFGDSIVAGNDAVGVFGGRTFARHTVDFLGQRMTLIANAGVGGNTSTQAAARFATDVVASAPGWVVILIGRNDLGADATATYNTWVTNVQAMLAQAAAARIRVVLCTLLPSDSLTVAQETARSNINNWIRALPSIGSPVLVADFAAAITDPATGQAYATALLDGTHPGNGAATRLGLTLANVLSTRIGSVSPLLTQEADINQQLLHGRFSGAGAGALPTDWFNLSAVPTFSKVARTDGVFGTWQRLTVAAGGVAILGQNVNVSAAMPIGAKVAFRVEYRALNMETGLTGGQYLSINLGAYNGSTFTTTVYDLSPGTGTENVAPFDRSGVLRTPPLTIPTGTTLVQAQISIGGGGNYDFDRADIRIVS